MQVLIGYKLRYKSTGSWFLARGMGLTESEEEAAVYTTWFFENSTHGAVLASRIRAKNLVIKPVYAEV